MIRTIYSFEIITPCFCAGADQSRAEIRAASIRGQLRWWFRVLGGTFADECKVFGSVGKDESGSSSALLIRVADFQSGPPWSPPTIDQNSPQNYIWHFASVSGADKNSRNKTGPRWTREAVIPPKSTFKVHVIWKRSLSTAQRDLFDNALHAFCLLGTLGLRGTRGLGAFHCPQAPGINEQKQILEKAGITIRERFDAGPFLNMEQVMRDYSCWFRYDLRKNMKATKSSPLGSSQPRQSSAIRFRPFKISDQEFSWLAYEAPHRKVLSPNSTRPQPLLEQYKFTGRPPEPTETRRR